MENLRLLKVQGYYNEKNSFDFVEEKSWSGHAILREDLTFEGIVNNYSSKNKDRLISGTLVGNSGAFLMLFTNLGICPCSFSGASTDKTFLGTWSMHYSASVDDQGKCKMIFSEIPLDEELVSDLETRMNSFKRDMSHNSKKFYDSLIENMASTVSLFLRNLETLRKEIEIKN